MGLFRKINSVSTLGLVNYRNTGERIARHTRLTKKAVRAQTAQQAALWRVQVMNEQQTAARQATYQETHLAYLAGTLPAAPGWYHCQSDPPDVKRWWNGAVWTSDTTILPPGY